RKTADLSFWIRGQHWIVEGKSGLEFNSLGAAALEGLAFKAKEPSAIFVLVSLYAKMQSCHARPILHRCGIPHAIDQVFALSDNSSVAWSSEFVERVNAFFSFLPQP